MTSDGALIHAEWDVIGYTQLLHENGGKCFQSAIRCSCIEYQILPRHKAHVQDEYTILPSGRFVISAQVWRTMTIPLPNHYVSIRHPDEGAPWA
jgi:hypothetical protein